MGNCGGNIKNKDNIYINNELSVIYHPKEIEIL